jgi:uncharacterized protein YbaR (Trm112 family)
LPIATLEDDWVAGYDATALAACVIDGEVARPIDDHPTRELNRCGLCPYCYRRLGAMPEQRLGALVCRACAARWALLDGAPDALPDPLLRFCRALGREAHRIGIDMQKLVVAIRRARHAG